ncbi:MAG: hypothetical protein LH606_13640 [Cytophagaceae bacterium]|nr:hypothetical protein [Cytophagaceae bacterium]
MDKDPELKDAPAKNPMAILEKLKLFSKIFVYSHSIIADADQERLRNLFPNRVEFKQKGFRPDQSEKLQEEFDSIKTALIDFLNKTKI